MKRFKRSISRLYTGIDTVWQMHDGDKLQTSGRGHERFWFCLVQVSTTRFSLFAAFPSVFMATDCAFEDAMHTSLPGSPPLSSNVGSPNGSGHDLDGMASRSTDEQLTEIRELLLPLIPLARSVAKYENHIQTITNSHIQDYQH